MSFFPPQKLIQEIPSVYENLHNLGATLWIPPAHANGVNQFVYPDGSTLSGTVGGTPAFDQSGKIPEILGGSPQATFGAGADKIITSVPPSDPLQMNGGGSWVILFTPDTPSYTISFLVQKSSSGTSATREGYSIWMHSDGRLYLVTSDNALDNTILSSPAGTLVVGERTLITVTLDASGNARLYKNCTQVATGTGMQLPSDTASTLGIGNTNSSETNRYLNSGIELFAVTDKILTADDCENITAQCGKLG